MAQTIRLKRSYKDEDEKGNENEEYITKKKRKSVPLQPNEDIKKHDALHLPKMVEAAKSSRC